MAFFEIPQNREVFDQTSPSSNEGRVSFLSDLTVFARVYIYCQLRTHIRIPRFQHCGETTKSPTDSPLQGGTMCLARMMILHTRPRIDFRQGSSTKRALSLLSLAWWSPNFNLACRQRSNTHALSLSHSGSAASLRLADLCSGCVTTPTLLTHVIW